jgi:hypothetical protein
LIASAHQHAATASHIQPKYLQKRTSVKVRFQTKIQNFTQTPLAADPSAPRNLIRNSSNSATLPELASWNFALPRCASGATSAATAANCQLLCEEITLWLLQQRNLLHSQIGAMHFMVCVCDIVAMPARSQAELSSLAACSQFHELHSIDQTGSAIIEQQLRAQDNSNSCPICFDTIT